MRSSKPARLRSSRSRSNSRRSSGGLRGNSPSTIPGTNTAASSHCRASCTERTLTTSRRRSETRRTGDRQRAVEGVEVGRELDLGPALQIKQPRGLLERLHELRDCLAECAQLQRALGRQAVSGLRVADLVRRESRAATGPLGGRQSPPRFGGDRHERVEDGRDAGGSVLYAVSRCRGRAALSRTRNSQASVSGSTPTGEQGCRSGSRVASAGNPSAAALQRVADEMHDRDEPRAAAAECRRKGMPKRSNVPWISEA